MQRARSGLDSPSTTERPEALAPGDMVRSQARRRLCRSHGGRLQAICRALPPPKRRFVKGNLARTLGEEPRPGAARKLTGEEEVLLVANACSEPPEGRGRWTLELLSDALVKLTAACRLRREVFG